MAGRIRRHWKGLLTAIVIVAVALVVGVPYVYIHFIEGEQPAPLSLSDLATPPTSTPPSTPPGAPLPAPPTSLPSTTSPSTPLPTTIGPGSSTATPGPGIAGTWTIGGGSQAGYRVHETLAGQGTVAVGRTDAVAGSITISETAITAVTVTVQVGKIVSDNSQRDRQFTGRIMEATQYPTAAFTLTKPIVLTDTTALNTGATMSATGDLTLHGATKSVTFPITVQRTAAGLAATGTIDIAYHDYGIDNPSIGGFVSVGESGTIEFLLVATRG